MTQKKTNPMWPNSRPDIDSEVLKQRYTSGESSKSLAAEFHCSVRTICLRLAKMGVTMRPQGRSPKPKFSASATWRGDEVSYTQLHRRVAAARGKPHECTQCGERDPAKRYEWANLTGDYLDVNDYARMCVSCHRQFDDGHSGRGKGQGSSRGKRAFSDGSKVYAGSVAPVEEAIAAHCHAKTLAYERAMNGWQETVEMLKSEGGTDAE